MSKSSDGLGSSVISYKGSSILRDYLMFHEDDIAWGIDDFGDLKELFIEIFNREPSKVIYAETP